MLCWDEYQFLLILHLKEFNESLLFQADPYDVKDVAFDFTDLHLY